MKFKITRNLGYLILAVLAAVMLAGGLLWLHSVRSCRVEVVFIPGWQTEHDNPKLYQRRLKSIYPGAKITVLKWKSSCPWGEAKKNADDFVPEVVKYIVSCPPEKRAELILVGHSLGNRIAVKTAAQLAEKRIKIGQFILLGAAMDCKTRLSAIPEASCGTSLNVFCLNDDTLKLIYSNTEGHLAAGFCGFDDPPAERFLQYELPDQYAAGGVKIINHTVETYFGELKRIVDGQRTPYRPKYDYSEVDLGMLPVPGNWFIPAEMLNDMQLQDEYAGWKLVKTRVPNKIIDFDMYILVDNYGRIVQYSFDPTGYILRRRFNIIKKQIKLLPSPEAGKGAPAADKP